MQEEELPSNVSKNQIFKKTDMMKYENTWLMNPHSVVKGQLLILNIKPNIEETMGT